MQGYEYSKACFELPLGWATTWHTQFLRTLNFETLVNFQPKWQQWMVDILTNRPFCSNILMISSERKISRWSVYITLFIYLLHPSLCIPRLLPMYVCLSLMHLDRRSNQTNFKLDLGTSFVIVRSNGKIWTNYHKYSWTLMNPLSVKGHWL